MNAQLNKGEVDRVKDRAPVSDVVGRYVDFDRKKSKPSAGIFWACCPFHGERSPSFKVDDRKGFYHCFGCGATGDVITFLREIQGCSFAEAIQALGGRVEDVITPERRAQMEREREVRIAEREREQQETDEQRSRVARATFRAGRPINGTLAEQYLLGRGIPAQEWERDRFRFAASLKYDLYPSRSFPALVAAVTNADDEIIGIHRTYLDAETAGKAKVPEGMDPKLAKGPITGGAVRIGGAAARISVCEGIETAFGIRAIQRERQPVWACLGTSGIRGVVLPSIVRHVDIWCDGDLHRFDQKTGRLLPPPGQDAAADLARRLAGEGRTFAINEPDYGDDWLDVWNGVREFAEEKGGCDDDNS